MIFVTVGTQRFQFNRLFKELDRLIKSGEISEEVVAQTGYTDYQPEQYQGESMVSPEKMDEFIDKSTLVITHAGTSSIIKCLKQDKKVVVVPRVAKYGEHVDDHQLEIAELFAGQNLIEPVYDIKDLKEKINAVKGKSYSSYKFDNTKLIGSIDDYLTSLSRSL
ncbi:PssE/Cps14G family polysaccharide biosynthesis glycosyltransferase [Pseudalkalibacillus caeni]|uniref:Glycosyltransferase family 28 n=1 Tax=Exobacillus caeni TaxID=2574798 RepID=A0A5R9EYN6_9BACL|nr:PssE/Cps14G family polysaccharide biosynthesis glycosyltransferase [Pseudalkalibacillus caeni]TLS35180.1 glycosyltransferase family 28 [Pseudalkalibacillus caeni]